MKLNKTVEKIYGKKVRRKFVRANTPLNHPIATLGMVVAGQQTAHPSSSEPFGPRQVALKYDNSKRKLPSR